MYGKYVRTDKLICRDFYSKHEVQMQDKLTNVEGKQKGDFITDRRLRPRFWFGTLRA